MTTNIPAEEENPNKRRNRGKRVTELTEEERKKDDDFWSSNAYFNEKVSSSSQGE